MDKSGVAVVILAAGKGTRMKSDLPKVLHLLRGEPLVRHVVRTARLLADAVVVVIGYKGELVREALTDAGVDFAWQREQLGTGHAVKQAREALNGFSGKVAVLSGDVPLIRAETMQRLYDLAGQTGAAVALISAEHGEPKGYGRVLRNAHGQVTAIVEERDATPEQKAITEINGGIYLFDAAFLWEALGALRPENDQNEYYLTDVVKIAIARGKQVAALKLPDIGEISGINTLEELEALDRRMAEGGGA